MRPFACSALAVLEMDRQSTIGAGRNATTSRTPFQGPPFTRRKVAVADLVRDPHREDCASTATEAPRATPARP